MTATTDRPKVSLRQFWADLPTPGRWLLSTVAIQTLGRGLTLPFTVIYIHEVRGIGLGTAGTLLALIAVVALLVTGPGGSLTDRLGARRMLIAGTSAQLVGCTILAFATTVPMFVAGFVLLGFNFGVSWPAFNALIASVVSGQLRQQYFGVNFALVNLGIGLGGVVGGLFVDVNEPMTFTWIFLADALSMLVPLGLLLGPLRHVHGRAERPADAPTVGYLDLLRRPPVLWLTFITFLCTFIGYGQIESGFPAFSRQVGEVSTQVIGFAFAVNTLVIVALQFTVLKAVTGRRRTRGLLVMVALWVVSWLILAAAGFGPETMLAAVAVVAFMGVFGLGEIFMQIAIPAITNDMADDHIRGRANAVNAGAFQGGAILGPIVSGLLLEHDLPVAFIATMLGGLVVMAVAVRFLERQLTPAENGVTAG
ncbi:membrane protein [Knoellia sinensis KCTC 19936]|uniref:Membrane protein n=1 Tax=Knoellia sinensis KCTC 19936 TaxID=1385520 RepID=A0A0A0IZM7_9MICO|nr:MFS transporter [Knoellia sinensis]KGN30625.1 membrane protein [Knoellia sinensis KCTC 19936]